jgi:predicted dinucleotide-binding enzyme
MDIAVLGAGNVGGGIGKAWAQAGHTVTFGVPNPQDSKVQDLIASIPETAKAATPRDAAAAAPVILLATPWPAAQSAITSAGGLSGKILIDATNPLLPDFSWLEDNYSISGAERVAQWAAGASVFKAFNQTGAENMADPSTYANRPVMFTCGDDAARKPEVLRLIEEIGFEAVDAGPLRAARLIEPYGMLWITLAHARGLGRDFALAIERRPKAHA